GIEVGSLFLLFVARTAAGIAAANFSIAQATIADVTAPHERAKNFGIIGAAFGLGFIVGPLLAGWITALTSDPATPFWVASALGVVNMLMVTFFLDETRPATKEAHRFSIWKGIANVRAALKDVDARPVYLANFLYMSGFFFFNTLIGILLVSSFGFTAASVGTFFGVVGACVVVTQLGILRIVAKRFGERTVVRISIPVAAVAVALYPFAPSAWVAFALIPLFAVSQGLTMANLTALISRGVSAEKQGTALGISSSLVALAQGVIPLVAGLMSSAVGLTMPFLAGGALMLGAWYVLFGMFRGTAT
ncbi:MAG: MFS transporter, partial [Patescibacteria group bacterium]